MRRVVVIILDGLRRDFVDARRTPILHAFARRGTWFAAHRSVFPSATRVVSASFATGCYPARHGLQGNSMALVEAGRIVPHDAGRPGFLAHKRAITGCALAVPTLAERLAGHGGAVVFNNVSPGAAYAHDPDGFGHVHHRAGSFGPGRVRLDPLPVRLDMAGDRAMTDRFIAETLGPGGPALAVLWCGEPDHIQHNAPLGSPEHLGVLAEADANAGRVIEAVDRLRAMGDDVLLLLGSDHGHETVTGLVDVEADLIAAGLKARAGSDDVAAVSNGTSSLIYVDPQRPELWPRIAAFLAACDWAGITLDGEGLSRFGQSRANALAFAVSLRSDCGVNEHGILGCALAALPAGGERYPIGCGQHGGLGEYEQSPFLMIEGDGFAIDSVVEQPSSMIDLAPTTLRHLRRDCDGMEGRVLQGGGG